MAKKREKKKAAHKTQKKGDEHPALHEHKKPKPKKGATFTGKYVICPGSWGQAPVHFLGIKLNKKGTQYHYCSHCDCMIFFNGDRWYEEGLDEKDVERLQELFVIAKRISRGEDPLPTDEDDGIHNM